MDEKKYIDCEAAIDAIYNIDENAGARGSGFADHEKILRDDAIYALENAPAADVRPVVRGRWVDDNGNLVPWDELNKDCPRHSAYCSVCGEWLTASDEYPVIGNFCPNCGADMREEI